jgi:hypothetical protein
MMLAIPLAGAWPRIPVASVRPVIVLPASASLLLILRTLKRQIAVLAMAGLARLVSRILPIPRTLILLILLIPKTLRTLAMVTVRAMATVVMVALVAVLATAMAMATELVTAKATVKAMATAMVPGRVTVRRKRLLNRP